MNKGECPNCGKTVYATEAVTIGPPNNEVSFHLACFKCQQPGCNWKLTVGTYKYTDGKAYCQAHNPMSGASYGSHVGNQRDIKGQDIQHALSVQKETPLVNKEVKKWK